MARELRGLFSAVLVVALVSGSVATAGCGTAPNVSKPDDLSWIHSRTTLFGVDAGLGVFQFRLGSNRLQRIGHHVGASIDEFHLSDDHTKLIYGLSGASDATSSWLYDLKSGRETQLHPLAGDIDAASVAFSPDAQQVVWIAAGVYDPPISVLDLRTGRRSSYRLPEDASDKGSRLFGLAWSHSGDQVLVARRRHGQGEDFFAIDAQSGAAQKVEGSVESEPADAQDASVHYYRNGAEVGHDCILCRAPPLSQAPLLGGAEVVSSPAGDVVIRSPGAADVVVATASRAASVDGIVMTCGPAPPAIWRVIDRRYIIYTRGDGYWVYGVAEKRRARLPGRLLTW